MQSYIVSAFALVLVACSVLGQDQYYGKYEPTCIRAGGLCITKTQCEPNSYVAEEGHLCPEQESKGFECCYGLPLGETRCRMHGGECVSNTAFKCPTQLLYKEATDCADNQFCCRFT